MSPTTSSSTAYADAKSVELDDIPVIDLADLVAGTPGAVQAVASQIVEASQRIGFFYVKNHGIAPAVIDGASRAMRGYFALPAEVKARTPVNTSQRGWMATGMAKLEGSKTHDLKEIFFWGPEQWHPRLDARKGVDSLVAENTWPDESFPALRRDLLPYYDEIQRVGGKLLSAIAVGLGRGADFFEQRYTSPMARGQLVYYPVSTAKDESEERFGSAPHTDFGVLTLLLQDMNGGLQVRNRTGEWVAATPIPGTLVCNIGDLLNRWSNETLSSNLHRVINRSGNERHSIAIFFDPDPDAVVSPEDLGFPEGMEKYPPITVSDYIHGKNKKNFTQYQQGGKQA
ncbi:isopenicillin N synthase family dioxygenase [Variovorax terrae]|uniref:2-oxoglutarate-dependent ethylene/succinate-forming enzyme n=1 Tax=Variovorax terrae TaxID=2923278 RepID=A0A9X2AQJ2_9BURK|nr:2-oxoglutarate and iron-dependent oxygenase domain-containing protein [Variovorax terrae]MCJ0764632.1 isopenicillin N synthase family oxygenase [Variovorax terrae]